MFGETAIRWPSTVFQLHAPRLYLAMFRPRPGNDCPLYTTVLVVNHRSAKSSRSPNTLAHQASEVPHPSHAPWSVPGSMVTVWSARAVPVPVVAAAITAAAPVNSV